MILELAVLAFGICNSLRTAVLDIITYCGGMLCSMNVGMRQWFCGLLALQAIAGLGLLADDVKDAVNELCALRVVSLGPVVACAGLAEDEVVWPEYLAVWPGPDGVHRAWLLRGKP